MLLRLALTAAFAVVLSTPVCAQQTGTDSGTGTGGSTVGQGGQSSIGGATSVDQGSALEATINQNSSQQRGGTQDGVEAIGTLNDSTGGFAGGSSFLGGAAGQNGNFNTQRGGVGGGRGGGGGGNFQGNQGQGQRRVVRPQIKIAFNFPSAVPRATRSLTSGFTRLNERTDNRFEGVDFAINDKGLVTITGTVKDQVTKKVAEAYIRLEPGVRKIKSELQIAENNTDTDEADSSESDAANPATSSRSRRMNSGFSIRSQPRSIIRSQPLRQANQLPRTVQTQRVPQTPQQRVPRVQTLPAPPVQATPAPASVPPAAQVPPTPIF